MHVSQISNEFLFLRFLALNVSLLFNKTSKTSKKIRLYTSLWFTKLANFEKLFISVTEMLLSSGIILKYANLKFKFLKKRLKTWYLYIEVYQLLCEEETILIFKNLFGLNFKIFLKIFSSPIQIFWCFIKFFYLNFTILKKRKRRIKKWITKKYLKTFI